MEKTISATERRRSIQIAHNEKHGITPKALKKEIKSVFDTISKPKEEEKDILESVAESEMEYLSKKQIQQKVKKLRVAMERAADELDFPRAAKLRDEIKRLKELIDE